MPGVVALAATDKGLLYEGAFGTRVLGNGPAMTLDTVFRIASMTKAITSVAAMQLVEQGKLTLDEPVPNIDPALGSPQVLEGFDAAGAPRMLGWVRESSTMVQDGDSLSRHCRCFCSWLGALREYLFVVWWATSRCLQSGE